MGHKEASPRGFAGGKCGAVAAKTRILVVEDERIVAKDIENRLRNLGYAVVDITSSGEKAIEKAAELKPDMVLMDIRLKGHMDGIEAAERIRSKLDIPVVYLTAYGSESIIERAKITEPFGYIMKPFEDKELHTVIEIAVFRHGMEKRLKESEYRYRRLFEDSRDALFIIDSQRLLVDCNHAFLDLFGLSREEALQTEFLRTAAGEPDIDEFFNGLTGENALVDREMHLLRRDGTVVVGLMTITGLTDKEGVFSGYQGSIHDITRRKELESQLSHAQKMEMIGTFASQIAHDFNNIITAMLGYAKLTIMKATKGAVVIDYSNKILALCDRATDITQDLLIFGRKQMMQQRVIDVNSVVYNLNAIMQEVMRKSVCLETVLSGETMKVFADPGQIERVLTNLVNNAQDAMPDGGKITIRVDHTTGDNSSPGGRQSKRLSYARIRVEDTGMGMAKETLDRIFEPFYTTKKAGKGTGLGLAIAYSIIQQHKGHIEASSELHRGSVFTIYLPLAGSE